MLDAETGHHRDSTLADLHALMQVLDRCPSIHYGPPVVARDPPTPLALDRTPRLCPKGTVDRRRFDNLGHVDPVVDLFDISPVAAEAPRNPSAGDHRAAVFSSRPRVLRSAGRDRTRNAAQIQRHQAGATSPAPLAAGPGSGRVACRASGGRHRPGHPCIFAFAVYLDLRTALRWRRKLPSRMPRRLSCSMILTYSTVAAGMTDSKV